MTTETWKLEKDLCRCCHSEGNFKKLSEPVVVLGEEEMYLNMLKDCFDVDLFPVEDMACANTICEACILRLRDATNFKKQVKVCEERFRNMYYRNVIKVCDPSSDVSVKIEHVGGEINEDCIDNDVNDLNDDDYHEPQDFIDEEEYKSEDEVESKAKKKRIKSKKKSSKTVQPKKNKQKETGDSEKKKGGNLAQKFRLKDEDFTKVGESYKCTRCDKTYDKYCSLRFHIKTKHYKIPRYNCPICMKDFMTPAPLAVHKLEVHNVDDRFKCNACKGVFNTKVQLRKHINNFHMLGEKYKCEFCEYESFSFEGMYKHKFKHKTVKDHHCKFCRKSFLRKTTLDLHERIHTGDRRKVCSVCGQAFVQKASLNYHMTKYHPEVNF